MVTSDNRPDAGGNTVQADDGRDEQGRLPEPLDSAHFPPTGDGPAILLPGMAPSQPAGTAQADAQAVADAERAAVEKPDAKADKAESKGLTTENTPTRAPAKPGTAKPS